MRGIIMQIAQAAKRDAVFLSTAITIFIIFLFAFFIGSTALVENAEMKIIYTAGLGRIATMYGLMIFITFYIKRLFENREIEVILSRPISRVSIVTSMIIGLFLLFLVTLIPVSFILLFILKVNIANAVVWISSIALEGFVVCAASLFFGLFVNSSVHTMLICFAFYMLARGIGSFVAYLEMTIHGGAYQIAGTVLKICSMFIPRLDLFGKTSWLLYGNYTFNVLALCVVQSLIFGGLLIFGSIFEFKRKQF